jgi:hypothetical protein
VIALVEFAAQLLKTNESLGRIEALNNDLAEGKIAVGSPDEWQPLLQKLLGGVAVAVCYLLGTLDGRVVVGIVASKAWQLHRAFFPPFF